MLDFLPNIGSEITIIFSSGRSSQKFTILNLTVPEFCFPIWLGLTLLVTIRVILFFQSHLPHTHPHPPPDSSGYSSKRVHVTDSPGRNYPLVMWWNHSFFGLWDTASLKLSCFLTRKPQNMNKGILLLKYPLKSLNLFPSFSHTGNSMVQ